MKVETLQIHPGHYRVTVSCDEQVYWTRECVEENLPTVLASATRKRARLQLEQDKLKHKNMPALSEDERREILESLPREWEVECFLDWTWTIQARGVQINFSHDEDDWVCSASFEHSPTIRASAPCPITAMRSVIDELAWRIKELEKHKVAHEALAMLFEQRVWC